VAGYSDVGACDNLHFTPAVTSSPWVPEEKHFRFSFGRTKYPHRPGSAVSAVWPEDGLGGTDEREDRAAWTPIDSVSCRDSREIAAVRTLRVHRDCAEYRGATSAFRKEPSSTIWRRSRDRNELQPSPPSRICASAPLCAPFHLVPVRARTSGAASSASLRAVTLQDR
jgi:hypothetical protein